MSATPTRPDLPQFALELARARAKSLARQKRLPAHEREDIEQHFLVELWRRWHRLDEKRGRLAGFVVRVIDNATADLIKREAAPSRGGSLRFISLEGQVGTDDGEIITLSDRLAQNMALWPTSAGTGEAVDLRVDLGRAVKGLPPELQDLCGRLSHSRVSEIAHETENSRSSIYRSIAAIRRHFLDAGLRSYVDGSATLPEVSR